MQHISSHIKLLALALGLGAFASCSHDEVESSPRQPRILYPILGANKPFAFSTRANPFTVTGVGDYEGFDQAYPTPINPAYKNIGVFPAQDGTSSYSEPAGQFVYPDGSTSMNWESNVPVENGATYYVYGFMPNNFTYSIGETSYTTKQSIQLLSGEGKTWADGAQMTFSNLPAVTGADICAIVGVKPGDPTKALEDQKRIDDSSLRWDNAFQFYYPSMAQNVHVMGNHRYDGIDGDNNCIYLLLDHLYSNINIELYLDKDYAEQRIVEITQVKMRSAGTSGRLDLNVEVLKESPYVNIISYKSVAGATAAAEATLFPIPQTNKTVVVEAEGNYKKDEHGDNVLDADNKPIQLYTSIPGYFAPATNDVQFTFEFEYNVYDGKNIDATHPYGNCVRYKATAINHWNKTEALLQEAYDNGILTSPNVTRGLSFQVKVKIAPTYLYQLSGPDLDTPTFTIQ